MIGSSRHYIKDRSRKNGWRNFIQFEVDSADTSTFFIREDSVVDIFSTENVASWTITKNGVSAATSSSYARFSVAAGDKIVLSITRSNLALAALFIIGAKGFNQVDKVINILDYSDIGGDSRYAYVLKDNTTMVCVDTDLLTLANLKTVIAVTNNGSSLTIQVTGHGFSNGNVISLVDLGGFTADVNHKPWTISNVTTDTFDIPATVTGTWDSVGYLCGAWITNPIIATISLPVSPATVTYYNSTYRPANKRLYVFGVRANNYGVVCTIDADPASGGFNTVSNFDQSVANAFTSFLSATYSNLIVTYDPINDQFYCVGGAGTYTIPATNISGLTLLSSWVAVSENAQDEHFFYGSEEFHSINVTVNGVHATHNNKLTGIKNVLGNSDGFGIYSKKTEKLWHKNNAPSVRRYSADALMTLETAVSPTHSWYGVGCAVNALDKLYFFRANGTFSYSGTVDLMIWDEVLNTGASKEDTYICCPGTAATFIRMARFSHYSDFVVAIDNGSAGRLHVFDTTRASGKKYIGYVAVGGVLRDVITNNLEWL